MDSDNLKPDREGYRLELSNDIIDWYGDYCDEDDLNVSQKKAFEEFKKNYVPEKVTLFRQDRSPMYQDELRIAM